LHLAEALGIPCTALFGPTVKDFGFFPQGPGHRVFELNLDCRPCSVHGTEKCPLGHHHCLLQLDPADISRHLAQVLTKKAA
jgi:heptosyltransferase II